MVSDDSGTPSTNTIDPDLDIQPSYKFFDYLNEQRAALGLPELEWSDSLYEQCVEEDNERGFLLHTEADVGEIILQTYDSDVASWYQDFYDDAEHREIMETDCSKTVDVSGVGEAANYVTTGNIAACVVCYYDGYYCIRMMFS